MKYGEPSLVTRDAYRRLVAEGAPADVAEALVGLVLADPERTWLQTLCLETIAHDERLEVRSAATISLGHLARLHGQIDRDLVVPVLTALLGDARLGPRAADALDDIEMFA